jgi:hypothetical protein
MRPLVNRLVIPSVGLEMKYVQTSATTLICTATNTPEQDCACLQTIYRHLATYNVQHY